MGDEALMRGGCRSWAPPSMAVAIALAAPGAAAQPPPEGRAPAAGEAQHAPSASDASSGEDPAVEQARQHFREGLDRTAEGRLVEALAAFQEAYDLSPSYRILYNIGQVSRHVGDAPRSLRAFERYLADGGAEIEPARRAEVEAEIAALRPQVGTLRVKVGAGAAVLLDGERIGEAPLEDPIYVRPGARRLRAERPGQPPAETTIEVAAGQSADVELALPAPPRAPVPPQPRTPPRTPPAPQPPPDQGRSPLWIGWAATGALAAGAVVTGALALVSAGQLDDARYAGPDRRPPADSEVSAIGARVDALAVATDVLLGATAVGLGITLTCTLIASGDARPAGGALRVAVSGGPGGVWVAGSF